MPEKSTIIIGAGLAGLSAGCYGRMNGYKTTIFEMHNRAGGLCTSWKRKGYTIGTSGWLTGSRPTGGDFHRFWKELGVLQGQSFVDYPEYARIQGRDGRVLVLYTDIDRLARHLNELAPDDKDAIAEFVQVLHAFAQFSRPVEQPPELSPPAPPPEMPPFMMKWMGMRVRDLATQFKSAFLKETLGEGLPVAFFFAPDNSVVTFVGTLASMHVKAAGYPVGGALGIVQAIERRYHDLGGEIRYKSSVVRILVEKGRAVGVRLADGTEPRADVVISAADGHATVFDMLEGNYVSDEVRGYYDNLPKYPPLLFISLGVARSFEQRPASVAGDVFPLAEPVKIAGREWKWFAAHPYTFDPSVAPEGKTLIRVMLATDYDYWRRLKESRESYMAEKDRVADQVVALLDRRYPGLAGQVEMRDVSTPLTFERYTGNWRGSWMGWVATPETLGMHMSKTLPGLEGLFMIGQWVMDSSLPGAVMSGRHVTQILCKQDGREFKATMPSDVVAEQAQAGTGSEQKER